MYDSTVKSPVGIEYGSDYQLGNYDQCMGIKSDFIAPKYCLLDVNVDGYSIRNAATRHHGVSFKQPNLLNDKVNSSSISPRKILLVSKK